MQKIIEALIKWAPSGLGLGATVYELWSQDWMQAVILALLTGCSSLWVKFSSKFMEEAEKEAEKRGGTFAQWVFAMLDRLLEVMQKGLIQFWWDLTSNFEGKYYKQLEYICRGLKTQGMDNELALELQQVFVPLKIAQKRLTQISPNLIQVLQEQTSSTYQLEIGELLAAMQHKAMLRHLAILGPPGSGKTTLLRYLTLAYVQGKHRQKLHSQAPTLIPVFLELRKVYEPMLESSPPTLIELIIAWMEQLSTSDPLKLSPKWLAKKLHQNKLLILLDGLDEVAELHKRQQVSKWVDQQLRDYPDTPFILTSRKFGYENAQLQEDLILLEVQGFNRQQREQFIQSWCLGAEIRSHGNKDDSGIREEASCQAENLIEQINNSPSLAFMATNPLLLTMIATVHRRGGELPQSRVELYKEICQILLEKRPRAKGYSSPLSTAQKQSILQAIALGLMYKKTRFFTSFQVQSLIKQKLANMPSVKVTPEVFLEEIRNISGLLSAKEQEGIYEFAHRSFQEYLAAVYIKSLRQEKILLNVFKDQNNLDWWAETIRLYVAQSDATNLIRAALNYPTVESLTLAFDCSEESEEVQPEVKQQLQERLEEGLESPDLTTFKLAAEVQLARRLSRLKRIDDEKAIDPGYVTYAEYQLFLDSRDYTLFPLLSRSTRQAQPSSLDTGTKNRLPPSHFSPGMAKKPVIGITFEDAQEFCIWLSANNPSKRTTDVDGISCYRLPTEAEVQQHPTKEHTALVCWSARNSRSGSDIQSINGIRIVKVQIQTSSRYEKLYNYLANRQWRKADEETNSLITQAVSRKVGNWLNAGNIQRISGEDLRMIDQLWVQLSRGRFGFSVQRHIYLQILGLDNPMYKQDAFRKFGRQVGWHREENREENRDERYFVQWIRDYEKLIFTLESAPMGHLPALIIYERYGYGEGGWIPAGNLACSIFEHRDL